VPAVQDEKSLVYKKGSDIHKKYKPHNESAKNITIRTRLRASQPVLPTCAPYVTLDNKIKRLSLAGFMATPPIKVELHIYGNY
jgi:hypothetical protein